MRFTGVVRAVVWLGALGLGCASTHPTPRGSRSDTHAPATSRQSTSRAATTAHIERLLSSGRELLRSQRTAEAEAPLRQAVAEARRLGQAATLATTLSKLANCLVQLEQTTAARASIDEALSLCTPGSLEADRLIFDLQLTLAESFRYDQRPELSVEPFRAAVKTASRHEAEMASVAIDGARRLSDVLRRLQRDQESAPLLEHALELASRDPDAPSTTTAIGADLLAAYAALGRRAQADALFARFHGIARQLRPDAGIISDITLAEVFGLADPASPTPMSAGPAIAPPTTPPLGQVSNAAEVVAAMRGDFQKCYQATLATDAQEQGSVRIVMRVGADGRVTEVKSAALSLSASTVDCALRRAGRARFNAPEGGNAVIAVPLTFVKH